MADVRSWQVVRILRVFKIARQYKSLQVQLASNRHGLDTVSSVGHVAHMTNPPCVQVLLKTGISARNELGQVVQIRLCFFPRMS